MRQNFHRAITAIAIAWISCAAWSATDQQPKPKSQEEVRADQKAESKRLEFAWTTWYVQQVGLATSAEKITVLAQADARFAVLLQNYDRAIALGADPGPARDRILALLAVHQVELP